MLTDIRFTMLTFDIIATIQFTYIFPYFMITIGMYALVYCFSSSITKYWQSSSECNQHFINWFVSFLIFTPFATIMCTSLVRRIQERFDYYVKIYTFYERKIKIKLCNTYGKKYVVGFLFVDLFHFIWAIVGLVYTSSYDKSKCE